VEQYIGKVTHYFTRIGVAVLELEEGLAVGDTVHICGHTTDFVQQVESLEVEHRKLQAVGAGADVALMVEERVRSGDKIYKVIDQTPYF
jgi:hypothetical protein